MAFGIDDAVAAGLKVLDKFIPDPEAKAEAEAALRSALISWDQSQNEVNRTEAAHNSIFVAGWRPFVGWVCGVACAWNFVGYPILNFILVASGLQPVNLMLDINTLMALLTAMLGIGGLRTYEKIKGV